MPSVSIYQHIEQREAHRRESGEDIELAAVTPRLSRPSNRNRRKFSTDRYSKNRGYIQRYQTRQPEQHEKLIKLLRVDKSDVEKEIEIL